LDLKNRACVGKSIRESRIREKTHGIIVGIERNGKRTLNPESDWILETDDIVWIAGDKKKINIFIND
jgi:CPA2 family monovalent cation:H+ antiporter-2